MTITKPIYQSPEQLNMELGPEGKVTAEGPLSAEEVRLRSETARAAFVQLKGEGSVPAWYEEFEKLVQGGWDWRVAAYIAWASSPRENRLPKTQDELARLHLGLTSDRVISTWRKNNPVIDQMVAALQAAPLWEQRADHFKALNDGAVKAGSDYKFYRHLELVMKMRGDFIPVSKQLLALKKKADSGVGDLDDLELEELMGPSTTAPEDGASAQDEEEWGDPSADAQDDIEDEEEDGVG